MNFDYGKEAYFRTEELAKRLSALENSMAAPQYTTTNMSFKLYCKAGGSKVIKFGAIGAQKIKINVTVTVNSSTCTLKLNNSSISLTSGSASVERSISGGKNTLTFTFTGTANEWATVNLEVGGFIEKYSVERFLYSIGSTYYCYFDSGTFYVYNYNSSNPIVALYNLKYASAFFASNVGIMVAAINDSGAMQVLRYTNSGSLYLTVNVVGLYNKSLINVKNGYVLLYAIKGNYLWTGEVIFSGEVTLTKTGQRARDIYFRTVNSVDYLLVTDITGVVSICQISQSDYVTITAKNTAGRISGAKLAYYSTTPSVFHSKGGAIVERIFNRTTGRFSSDGYVTTADEAICLDNGRLVVRNGGDIKIISR